MDFFGFFALFGSSLILGSLLFGSFFLFLAFPLLLFSSLSFGLLLQPDAFLLGRLGLGGGLFFFNFFFCFFLSFFTLFRRLNDGHLRRLWGRF
jgi:hypothetical protein